MQRKKARKLMQILEIELENVKSYEAARVRFTPGVNAIVGHNGAGKSTLVEAVGFVLFDTLPYTQADFVRAGAKSARARVNFISGDDERAYAVERRIGSGAAYFVFDPGLDARVCEGKADVVRFLRQHLRLEPGTDLAALFGDAVGVPQGTLTASFLLNEASRKKVFDGLLRVEEYQRAWERLREPLNLLKARRQDVEVEVSRLRGRLERLPSLEAARVERAATIVAHQQELAQATRSLESAQAAQAAGERAREAALAAERALTGGRSKLQAAQAAALTAQQAQQDAAEAQSRVAANQAGHAAYVAAEAEQRALEAQVRQRQQAATQRSAADKRVALLLAKLQQNEAELQQAEMAATQVTTLAPQVAEQARLDAELEAARRQQARVADAQAAVKTQQQALTRVTERRGMLLQQLARVAEIQVEQGAVSARVEAQQVTLAARQEALTTLKTQGDLLREQLEQLKRVETALCPVCEQPLAPQHRADLMARNDTRLAAMRQQYRAAQTEVKTLSETVKQDEVAAQALQRELLTLARPEELTKLDEEIAQAQSTLAAAQQQVTALGDSATAIAQLTQALAALGDPRRSQTEAAAVARRAPTLAAALTATRNDLAVAQADLAAHEAALAAFGDLEQALDGVAATLHTHREAYQAVLSNQRQADSLPARQTAAESAAATLAQVEAAAAQLAAAYEAAVAAFDATAYAAAAQEAQTLQQRVGTLRGQLTLLVQTQAQAEAEIAELRGLQGALAAAATRIRTLEDESEALEFIRESLRRAGPHITETLIRQISDGARQIFSDLMADHSRHLAWEKDYSITLEVDGRKRVFSQLSGGEQMSAALSVRLALLREMSSIDVAFFDEPTANLDEVRREALARQILQVRGFQQLFVISHDDTFEQATQNMIRVERHAGKSVVSVG